MFEEDPKFKFDKTFQLQVLGLMLQDFEFLVFASDTVKPEYFSDRVLIWFFTAIRDHFLDYQVEPAIQSLANEAEKHIERNNIKIVDADQYQKCLNKIKQPVKDTEYVTKEVVNFCKSQAVRRAVMTFPKFLSVNDYSGIEKEITSALRIGANVGDVGMQYFSEVNDRIKERENKIDQKVLPTGITELDVFLRGGIRPGQLGIWMAPTSRGKCLKTGTPVLKYDGSVVAVEDIKVGEQLMGPDSTPRTVLGTTQGRGPLYQIDPLRGASWVCNDKHILTLKHTATGKVVDVPVEEYITKSKYFKHCYKQFSVGVEFPPLKDPLLIDPYFLGVWFGDGSKYTKKSGKFHEVAITKGDPEIRELVRDVAKRYRMKVRESRNSTSDCPVFHLSVGQDYLKYGRTNPIMDLLNKVVGPSCDVPKEYLVSSLEERRQLLAGFLDTDGFLKEDNSYDIVQKRKNYAQAICFLARSLGLKATLRPKEIKDYGLYWRVHISGKEIHQLPLRIARKRPKNRPKRTDPTRTAFKVTPFGVGDYAGFETDGDGRFLLGNFTVTHNSLALVHCGKRTVLSRKKVIHYTFELSADEVAERYDSSFSRIPISDLVDEEFRLSNAVNKLGRTYGNNLIIKDYPSGSASVNTLKSHLVQCLQIGFEPDLIIVDYLDLMKSTVSRSSRREELTDITTHLRGLFGELVIPGWTATQSRRGAISMETHTEEEVGEDIGKMQIADIVITLNQNVEELNREIMRLFLAKNRNGRRYVEIAIETCFERMCFYKPLSYSK